MEDISKLEQIEILFKEYDFMKIVRRNYIYFGEYQSEALHFCLLLNQYDTIDSIQIKVWDTFYKFFCTGSRYSSKKNKSFPFKESKEEAIKKIGTPDRFIEFSKKVKEILDG